MSDIALKCRHCNRDCRVSEYAAPDTLVCPNCGKPLEPPVVNKKFQLKMKRLTVEDQIALTGKVIPDSAIENPRDEASTVITDVHKVRQKIKGPAWIWSWLVFIVCAAALIYVQYWLEDNRYFLHYYKNGRLGLFVIFHLVVLIMAYDDSLGQGMLCLVPFYMIYYVFARMENLFIRSLFAAFYLALGAELYFMQADSLMAAMQHGINVFIVDVAGLIERAGEAPIQ